RALLRLLRLRGRCGDARPRRLLEEEGEPVGAARGRAVLHVPRLDGAQASREPGPVGGRPPDRRVGLPRPPLPRPGAAARVPAQLREPAARARDARPHLSARPRVLRPPRSPRAQARRPRDQPDRGARAAFPVHLLDARAHEPAGTAAGGAAPRGAARAAREAHPRRGRQDRQGDGARPAGTHPAGARRRSACGQRLEPPVHSVWHFTKVAFEDLTHADSRLWRTLTALLFKPGYLTREFLAGRRARYLPPVRLYLVLSVVFFLGASATHGERQVVRIHSYEHGAPGESAEGRAERLCRNEYYNGPWKERFHQACVRSALDNGRSLEEAFLHNLPRAMFQLLPLSFFYLASGVLMLAITSIYSVLTL